MKKVAVEVAMRHAGKKVGETYELSAVQAKALEGIGLVKPATQAAAKAIEKVAKAD
jgi:hypothetical protein